MKWTNKDQLNYQLIDLVKASIFPFTGSVPTPPLAVCLSFVAFFSYVLSLPVSGMFDFISHPYHVAKTITNVRVIIHIQEHKFVINSVHKS